MPVRVLFVCMGNICRSPTAEGVFRHFVAQQGLEGQISCDSAGTHGYHIGEAPDTRAQEAAARRGYDLSGLRARRITEDDFSRFDYVLAMDTHNMAILHETCPAPQRGRLRLFLDYAKDPARREVPDPYYGDVGGFEIVLDLAEQAARGLLEHIRAARAR